MQMVWVERLVCGSLSYVYRAFQQLDTCVNSTYSVEEYRDLMLSCSPFGSGSLTNLTFPYRDFSEYACGFADGAP